MGAFRPYEKIPVSTNENHLQRTSFESKNEDHDHLNINSHRFGLITQSCSKNSKADDANGTASMLGLPVSGNQEPRLININLNSDPYFDINLNQPTSNILPPKVIMPVPVVPNLGLNNNGGYSTVPREGIRARQDQWLKEICDNFSNSVNGMIKNNHHESFGSYGGQEGAGPFSMIALHSNLNSFPPGPTILKPDQPGLEKKCFRCKKTETPCWRNGPRGTKTLCNACGLRFSRKKLRWNPWF